MNTIVVDWQQMSKKIMKLFELYAHLAEEIDNLAQYAADLDIFWDGDANAVFMQSIGDDLVRSAACLIRIRDTYGLLRQAFDIYVEAHEQVQGLVSEYLNI